MQPMLFSPLRIRRPIDAAQKLGAEAPFSGIPPAYSYFLDKRSKGSAVRLSTFQRGMRDEERAHRNQEA